MRWATISALIASLLAFSGCDEKQDTANTNRAFRVYELPPSLGSPRFARGTARGALTRFPLRAGEP
jgi:hypothetical protein